MSIETQTHTHSWPIVTNGGYGHTHALGEVLTVEAFNSIEQRLDTASSRLDAAESRMPLYCVLAGAGAALVASPRKFSRRALFGLGRRR